MIIVIVEVGIHPIVMVVFTAAYPRFEQNYGSAHCKYHGAAVGEDT